MMDEFNRYRNKNGYIDFNIVPKRAYESPSNRIEAYEIDDDIYFFRGEFWYKSSIRELINEEIAKQVDIENAEYDLAILDGKEGTITKRFIGYNEIFKEGYDILIDSSNKRTDNTLYNYLLFLKKEGVSNNRIQKICRGMLENYILDIFSLQEDRNLSNLGFLEKAGNIRLAPRFDNEMSFLQNENGRRMWPFINSQNKKQYIIEEMPTLLKQSNPDVFRLLSDTDLKDPIIDYWETISWDTIPQIKKEEMTKAISLLNSRKTIQNVYKMIQKEMQDLSPFIDKASKTNFTEIYYNLSQYNIGLSDNKKEFFKLLYQTRVEMFFDQKQKIKNR